jgi:hypothetical protein
VPTSIAHSALRFNLGGHTFLLDDAEVHASRSDDERVKINGEGEREHTLLV